MTSDKQSVDVYVQSANNRAALQVNVLKKEKTRKMMTFHDPRLELQFQCVGQFFFSILIKIHSNFEFKVRACDTLGAN